MARTAVRYIVRCALALWVASASAAFAGSSTSPNPTVTFSSTGPKQVELYICGATGCANVIKTVTVLEPMPSLTSLSVAPTLVPQGGTVRFTATGAGKPPLTFSWRVERVVGGETVATFLGDTVDWVAFDPPDVYNVFLDLTNALDSITSVPIPVVVSASPFIFGDGFELGVSRWSAAQ